MAVKNRDFLKNKNRTFDNILDSIQTQADHLRHEGTVPTIAATTAGDGTCAISAESTDVAGTVTFSDTWADGDTLVITFSKAYGTAPKVILSHRFTDAGITLTEIDTIATSTTAITLTASGACAGALSYFVIETV